MVFEKGLSRKVIEEVKWKSVWSVKLPSNVEILEMSRSNNTEECVKLIEGGRDVNARDIEGNTPLHFAAMNGNGELAGILLFNEAIIDSVNRKHQTPLMLACMQGFEDIASMLITAGAEINFQDIDENTILH